MYVLLVYDIGEKRVAKALKICRCYLNWVQNSVFEGEIKEGKLKELLKKLREMIKKKEDSVLVYRFPNDNTFEKEVIGLDKNPMDVFL
ncbi:CRISPR-associated endonuclease Cas2 [bacterium]|nr:CRISPR-associated endonuclease Cas2 [bacterium]